MPSCAPAATRAACAPCDGSAESLCEAADQVTCRFELLAAGGDLPERGAVAVGEVVRRGPRAAVSTREDWAAVTAGLTLPYSSGAVEGHVNRIKMLKRQMHG
jgi:transposase